jgi:signal transduction histidine kinase
VHTLINRNRVLPDKYRIPLFITLVAAGFAGNYFSYNLFLNSHFFFGGIFALLVMQLIGLRWGIVAAAIIASFSFLFYSLDTATFTIITIVEVAVVGQLTRRSNMGMVLTDSLFWGIIGIPVTYGFYFVLMHYPVSQTNFLVVKQVVNAIANALAARIIFHVYALKMRTEFISGREILYYTMTFFVVCPMLIMLAINSRTDLNSTNLSIRTALAPYQTELSNEYVSNLTIMLLLLLTAGALSEFICNRVEIILVKLRQSIRSQPDVTCLIAVPTWPESGIKEINDLINDYFEAAKSVKQRVAAQTFELNNSNIILRKIDAERHLLKIELALQIEQLQHHIEINKRLISVIAHDLKTPLGLVSGSAGILDLYRDRLTFEERFTQNENIRHAVDQMSNLVNSMVSFNCYGSNKFCGINRPLDIGDFCRTVAEETAQVWCGDRVFNIVISPGCGSVNLNEMLFRRIVENLLSNAFKYTPSHGIVSLHLKSENNRLYLDVVDGGIGIPEKDIELIFNEFYRCNNGASQSGMGLGLSVVQESLTLLGGTITVLSTIGEGTTMRVEIPTVDLAQNG